MTLFIDNVRLYRRAGIKYTAVEDILPEIRRIKDEKVAAFSNQDLLALCASLPDMDFLIFTGFEDTPIDEFIFDKIPNNVLGIYASNAITFGGKVHPIPYGLQRKLTNEDHRQQILLSRMNERPQPTKLLYLNYSLDTNPERKRYNQHFGQFPWATLRQPISIGDADYNSYLSDIQNHAFMLCPSGNAKGCECHRDWETLYLRRVPVVEWSPYLEVIFKDIPVLFVDSLMNVTEKLLKDNYHLFDKMQHFDLSKLDIEVLYNKILSDYSECYT